MEGHSRFKLINGDGITAIIVHQKRALIMKRVWFPFIMFPGVWTFVAGKKKEGETYEETAYREVEEETGIKRDDLKLLTSYSRVVKVDKRNRTKFYNSLFVFLSSTDRVELNIENTKYRWASLSDIEQEHEYTNVFADKRFIERLIERAVNGKKLVGR